MAWLMMISSVSLVMIGLFSLISRRARRRLLQRQHATGPVRVLRRPLDDHSQAEGGAKNSKDIFIQ